MYKNRKAVSPVIATVILVAVAITISVAVAYWMGGISSQYTKFEKVEIVNAIVSSSGTPGAQTWTVKMSLKNTGTSSATIGDVYLNDRPLAASAVVYPTAPTTTSGNGAWNADLKTVPSGASANFIMVIMNGGTAQPFTSLSSGTTVNFKLHSAGGMDYLKLAELD